MGYFGEIFIPPASPNPEYDPRENMLRRIQDMDEAERRSNRIKQFMNLLNESEAGNISVSREKGATGGPATPPHVSTNADPANFQIVNEFNSFNLQNILPPVPPKWKHSETLLDEYCKFQHFCQPYF